MCETSDRNNGAPTIGVGSTTDRRPCRPRGGRPAPHLEMIMVDEHRDTVVVDDGAGSSTGAILGVIAIIVLLVAIWFFALGPGASPSTTNNNNSIDNNGGGNAPASQVIPNPVGP